MSSLWRPTSPCGPGCLPAPGTTPQVPVVVVAGRIVAALAVLAGVVVALPVFAVLPSARAGALARLAARGVLRALGVRRSVLGVLPAGPVLLVCNHISWLDVLALLAAAPVRMVAKREVRGWPVVGAVAAAAGTVFVDRARPRRLPSAVGAVAAALRAGEAVAVFAEGTTWCGRSGGPLRPAMFQAAIDAAVPVVAVAVGYRQATPTGGRSTTVAAFVGDHTLLGSVCRVITAAGLTARLRVGARLPADLAGGRRRMAALATAEVTAGALASPETVVRAAGAAVPPRRVGHPHPVGRPGGLAHLSGGGHPPPMISSSCGRSGVAGSEHAPRDRLPGGTDTARLRAPRWRRLRG